MKKLTLTVWIISVLAAFTSVKAEGYKVGEKAADFNLKNIDGKMISLSGFKSAKGFIVVFTCNHCPFAKAYEDRLIALDKKYKDLGYPVIAINPSDPVSIPADNFENMIVRAKDKGFTFPYLLDDDQKVYPLFGATKTPHVFVLQKDKKDLIVKYMGAIDNNYKNAADVSEKYVEKAVNSLLEGKEITTTSTVAVGCGIKAK